MPWRGLELFRGESRRLTLRLCALEAAGVERPFCVRGLSPQVSPHLSPRRGHPLAVTSSSGSTGLSGFEPSAAPPDFGRFYGSHGSWAHARRARQKPPSSLTRKRVHHGRVLNELTHVKGQMSFTSWRCGEIERNGREPVARCTSRSGKDSLPTTGQPSKLFTSGAVVALPSANGSAPYFKGSRIMDLYSCLPGASLNGTYSAVIDASKAACRRAPLGPLRASVDAIARRIA